MKNTVDSNITWSFVPNGLFYLFLLTAPLNVYGLGSGLFNFRFSRIFLVLTCFSIACELIIKRKTPSIRFQAYDYLIILYFFLVTLSGLYVENYKLFFVKWFGLVECLMILFVIRIFTNNIITFIKAVRVYVLSSILVILGAVSQLYFLRNDPFGYTLPFPSLLLADRYDTLYGAGQFGGVFDQFTRVSSTFGEPNMMAGYFASIVPFTVIIILLKYNANEKVSSLGYGLLAVGGSVAMISAVSKSGFISTFIALIIVIVFNYKRLSLCQRVMLSFLFVLIFAAIFLYISSASELFSMRIEQKDSGHMDKRIEAFHDYLETPYFGVGLSNYKKLHGHTILLTALLELGILGGIAVFIITLFPFYYYKLIRKARSLGENHSVYAMLFSAAFASYAAIFIGLYLYDYWIHPFTWISIGFLVSLQAQISSSIKLRHKELSNISQESIIY